MEKGFYVVISDSNEILWKGDHLPDARAFSETQAVRYPGKTFSVATIIQSVLGRIKTEWKE